MVNKILPGSGVIFKSGLSQFIDYMSRQIPVPTYFKHILLSYKTRQMVPT